MQVGDIISHSVLTVGPITTLRDAARAMVERRVGSVVILTDDGKPAIMTERDLMRAIASGADPDDARVEDYMTPDAISASPAWDVLDASKQMREGGFRHLLVMGENGTIEGILSMRDVLSALLDRAMDATSGERV